MDNIIIHRDYLQQFMRVSHMAIFTYILVNADNDGIYRGSLAEIAQYVDLDEEETLFIIDKNIDVEWIDGGLHIINHEQFIPTVQPQAVEEEDDENAFELTPEKQFKKNQRKSIESASPVENKFQESMRIFYPNVSQMKVPLTLTEYNILCKFVADCGNINIQCANELLIDTLQQLDASPTIKKKTDAYKTLRNWLNMKMGQRSFSFEYYRNINIAARRNEREAIKNARR